MSSKAASLMMLCLIAPVIACSTSPTGRPQLTLFPQHELNRMGATAYEEIRQEQPVIEQTEIVHYVECVTAQLLEQVIGDETGLPWEVTFFDDDSVNAFAVPGGKIGVHAGLVELAENQHQLATVIAHPRTPSAKPEFGICRTRCRRLSKTMNMPALPDDARTVFEYGKTAHARSLIRNGNPDHRRPIWRLMQKSYWISY